MTKAEEILERLAKEGRKRALEAVEADHEAKRLIEQHGRKDTRVKREYDPGILGTDDPQKLGWKKLELQVSSEAQQSEVDRILKEFGPSSRTEADDES